MSNSGSNTVKTNARRIAGALGIDYQHAFRLLVEAKTTDVNWTEAANRAIEEHG